MDEWENSKERIIKMEKNTEIIIEKLDQIDWHDIPIEKIDFSTNKVVKFTVKAFLFNETKQDYDKIILEFIDIINLTTDKIVLSNKSDFEINSFDYVKKENFECKLILLCGFSEPSLTISLVCKNINLK